MVERTLYYGGKKIILGWKEINIMVERKSYQGGKKVILWWKENHFRVERKSCYGGKETHIGTAYGIGYAIAKGLALAGAKIAFNCRG